MITSPEEFRQQLLDIQNSVDVVYTTLPSDEPRFIIDANSRTITIPAEFQFLGVKNDHNAETVYFEIDRYFDDEDLSQHTCVIQFANKNNSDDGGIYPVTTMDTTSVDGKIIFGWEIKSDATSLVGDIYFSVRFYSINSTDYVFTYNFNTLTAKSVILDTLDVDNQMIIENYPSELDAWTAKMDELSRGTEGKVEEVQQVSSEAIAEVNAVKESIPEDYNTLSNDVNGIKGDIVKLNDVEKNAYILGHLKSYPLQMKAIEILESETKFVESSNRIGIELPINEKIYVYNFNDNSIFMHTIVRYNDNGYVDNTGYNNRYCASYDCTDTSYRYYLCIAKTKSGAGNFTSDEIKNANNSIVVCSGIYSEKIDNKNLWKDYSTGKYVSNVDGSMQDNPNMAYKEHIRVYPLEILYINNMYVMGGFFDKYGSFISGVYFNIEEEYPKNTYQKINVPENAYYLSVSTRLANKNNIVICRDKKKIKDVFITKATFDGAYCPSDFVHHNFEFNNGYFMSNSNYCHITSRLYSTLDKSKISAVFKCSGNAYIRFGYCSSYYLTDGSGNIVVELDVANKLMKLSVYNFVNGETSVITQKSISHNINDGTNWFVSLEKDTINHYIAKLYNADCTSQVEMLESESEEQGLIFINTFNGWGTPRIELVEDNSVLYVKSVNMISLGNENPNVFIIGDSYVENNTRNPLNSYGRRLYDITNGNVLLSGRGGATASDLLHRIVVELNVCTPKYCVLQVGANDYYYGFDLFKTTMEQIIEIVKDNGVIPILTTTPRMGSVDNLSFLRQANEWIKNSGYKYIDVAMALSNGDGETQDVSKYYEDTDHPSIYGAECIINWIEANLPELIY